MIAGNPNPKTFATGPACLTFERERATARHTHQNSILALRFRSIILLLGKPVFVSIQEGAMPDQSWQTLYREALSESDHASIEQTNRRSTPRGSLSFR
jgi:hypothetical protein